jgi:hypothetical protein
VGAPAGAVRGRAEQRRWIHASLPRVKDIVVVAALILGFAALVTTHVAIASRLAWRERPRWRGLVALVVPPLAVLWALRAGWRRTAVLWLIAVLVYVVALVAAQA